jgi:hypothetical protein
MRRWLVRARSVPGRTTTRVDEDGGAVGLVPIGEARVESRPVASLEGRSRSERPRDRRDTSFDRTNVCGSPSIPTTHLPSANAIANANSARSVRVISGLI